MFTANTLSLNARHVITNIFVGIRSFFKKSLLQFSVWYWYSYDTKKYKQPVSFLRNLPIYRFPHFTHRLFGFKVDIGSIGLMTTSTGYSIITGNNFWELPKCVQETMLYHEYGHYINKDLEVKKAGVLCQVEMECAADEISAQYTSASMVYEFLCYFSDVTKDIDDSTYHMLEIRKENISRLIKQ